MKKMNSIDWIAFILLVVGGLNWGLYGAFKLDLVQLLLGWMPLVRDLVYVFVGLSAVYILVMKSKKM